VPVRLQELHRVQRHEPAHAEADHVDPIDLEALRQPAQLDRQLLGRAAQRAELEHPVVVAEHHLAVRLQPPGQR
jgi:hypothetical protein